MAQPTTSIFLNKTTPAPPSGQQNIAFDSDNGTPQQKVTASDPPLVGDTGTGGLAGNAPAPAAGDAAKVKYLHAGGSFQQLPLAVAFQIGDGSIGTNVCGYVMVPHTKAGAVTQMILKIASSDAVIALGFTIYQNGTSIFTSSPTAVAGAGVGTVATFTDLTSVPLVVNPSDIFTLDITSGSTSWKFTAQLE